MKNIWTLSRRELKTYFNQPIAYVLIGVFGILSGFLFINNVFVSNEVSMRSFFSLAPILFLIITPGIAMKLIAEEKKLGTLELLQTMTIRDYEIVLGKYFGAMIFFAIMLLMTFIFVISLAYMGEPDFGPIMGGYLAMFLMGGAFLAIGIFASSMTNNQVVALVVAFGLSLFLYIIDFGISSLPAFLRPILGYMSLSSHFMNIQRGVIDSRDILYYVFVSGFFLFVTTKVLQSRKY